MRALAVSGTRLFAGTDGGVFSSTDNGTQWRPANSGLPLPDQFGNVASVMCFAASGANLFAGTRGQGVFLSTNNGASWTHAGFADGWINALAVSDTNLFAATGVPLDSVVVYRTTDHGKNWIAASLGLPSKYVRCLGAGRTSDGTNGTKLFAGGEGGVFVSSDNGTSWSSVCARLANTEVWSLAVGENTLFAATGHDLGASRGAFFSTDNGANWLALYEGLTKTRVTALVGSGSYLLGQNDSGGVYVSTDYGRSWTLSSTGIGNVTVSCLAVCPSPDGTSLFAGTGGSSAAGIFRSTDNGTHWNAVNSGVSNTRVTSLAVSGTCLFAGTDGGGVLLSTNQGTSWTPVNAGLTTTVVSSLVIDGIHLFVGTGARGVFESTDNGASWTAVNTGFPKDKYGDLPQVTCFAASDTNLFAGTEAGVFRSTTNNRRWTAVNTGLTNIFVQAIRLSGTKLFAGTNGAGVWFRPLSEFIASADPAVTEVPDEFLLHQNYPNPFNPTTTITYELPKSCNVRLSVYDILGREVAVLVNERRDTGVHEVKLDAAGLSSGAYLYRIQAGDFVRARRLLLLH